jgi:phosphoglycolate phosphatase-like HAD superfamily hydrolase
MPGVPHVLSALSMFPLAICTNKPRRTALAVLRGLELEGYFALIVAGGDPPEKKPSPAPMFFIAERLGLAPAALVMVGDGPQDVLSAKAAGARSVGVEGGIQARERLVASAPDALLGSLVELPALIEAWLSRVAYDTRR